MNNKYLNVPCAFHHNQFVTNFCHARECLLPLCKTCISIHQREHTNISEPPNIGDVFVLMDRVRADIHHQREELRRKYPSVAKQLKQNQQANRLLFSEIERQRDQLIQVITQKYNAMLSVLMTSFESRQNELVTMHGNLETIESSLNNIEETLYRGKAMRSVIMWQSQDIHKLCLDTLKKIDSELNKPDRTQLHRIDKTAIINQLCSNRIVVSEATIDVKSITNLTNVLNKVVGSGSQQAIVDTERKSENRKSLNKLRNSGISLTEINSRLETKKNGLAAVRTPEKTQHPSALVTVRNEQPRIIPGMRVTTHNSRELKKLSTDSQQYE